MWLVPHDNIILDIDEDFFGCEAAETRFKQVRHLNRLEQGSKRQHLVDSRLKICFPSTTDHINRLWGFRKTWHLHTENLKWLHREFTLWKKYTWTEFLPATYVVQLEILFSVVYVCSQGVPPMIHWECKTGRKGDPGSGHLLQYQARTPTPWLEEERNDDHGRYGKFVCYWLILRCGILYFMKLFNLQMVLVIIWIARKTDEHIFDKFNKTIVIIWSFLRNCWKKYVLKIWLGIPQSVCIKFRIAFSHMNFFSSTKQWGIQDFPERGTPTPEEEVANLLFGHFFFLKTTWKWRNFEPEGGTRPWHPL